MSDSTAATLERVLSFQRDLAAELNAETDAGALWEKVLDALIRIEGIDCAWVQRLHVEHATTALVGARNLSADLAANIDAHGIDAPRPGEERAEVPLFVPRARFPRSATEDPSLAAFRCLVVIPVALGGETAAHIKVASYSTAEIPRWTALVLEGISIQVGGALARIRAATQLADYNVSIEDQSREYDSSEEKFRKIFQLSPVIMTLSDPELGVYLDVNDTFLRKFGFEREEVLGRSGGDLGIYPDSSTRDELYHLMREDGCVVDREITLLGKGGRVLHLIFSAYWLEVNRRPQLLVTAVDIGTRVRTEQERRRLAERLAQAQKLESVGRLAGGVAHDFNNMLAVIQTNAELGLGEAGTSARLRDGLGQIVEACKRSKELTRQLLAFARQQVLTLEVQDLNEAVENLLKMLGRLIGEHIKLVWRPADRLGLIRADGTQIDQIVTNLCINARDAIEDVGTITLETANVTLGAEDCADEPGLTPGEYVVLSVSDDGSGMDADTQARLFEPFFTTKGLGEGTGLGLATVHGIVEQSEGFIRLRSEVGKGTSLRVFFPRHSGSASPRVPATDPEGTNEGRGETILLVEDEPAILAAERAMLSRAGYVVLTASGPGEATRLAAASAGRIDLLVTDVVMPEMNGRDLAKRLTELYPGLRCMFVSGYTANVIATNGVLEEGVHFIEKPFDTQRFLAKVREALGD